MVKDQSGYLAKRNRSLRLSNASCGNCKIFNKPACRLNGVAESFNYCDDYVHSRKRPKTQETHSRISFRF